MLQPTLHSLQTLGTLVRSQGRARKRKGIEVSAPTGQSSIVLPEKGESKVSPSVTAISECEPRSITVSASSPAISRWKRTQR